MPDVPILRLAVLSVALIAAGCDREQPLPGERIPIREGEATEAAAARAVALPAPRVNADWSHRNGAPGGRPPHPALAPVPQLRWSTSIGEGESKRTRIVTAPVVAGGLVFAMDAAGRLSAVARNGGIVWSRSVVPEGQVPTAGPGGGMAVSGGVLYVTTGFGEALALDPASGAEYWSRILEAPVRAAPLVQGGRVIVVLRNDVAYALDSSSGATLWRAQGAGGAGLLGGAVPAADGSLVVLPFASGEVMGVLARNGVMIWDTALIGGHRDLARNRIHDISGDPVIDGQAIYASNQAGRTMRIDRTTGERTWTMQQGAYGPAWPVGGSIFLLSDEGALVRAEAASGAVVWSVQLPEFYRNRGIFRERQPFAAVTHFGPILAGGRLWVASGDGYLRGFDPSSGRMLAEIPIPGGAAAPPAVAGGVMYIVNRDGQLLAFQ